MKPEQAPKGQWWKPTWRTGLLDEKDVGAFREEARRKWQSPLSLLAHRRVLSEETLASLRRVAAEESSPGRLEQEGAATLERAPSPEAHPPEVPLFPVPGWERYQGVRFLGQGGMGQVFLARDLRLHRNVALKFLRSDNAEVFRRVLMEVCAQARVEHERVCQVYEVGEVEGRPYIAMQFIDGQPLQLFVHSLGVEQKVVLLRDAAEGGQAAHRAGLIHRDIKPSNILVERAEDGRLKPYVMDFGLARDWREQHATATGAMAGTPHFRAWGPNIPVDVEAIVLKCLEKERSARYDSPRALVEDLDRFLAGEPVRARPAGLGQLHLPASLPA